MKKTKQLQIIILILLIMNLCATATLGFCFVNAKFQSDNSDIQYVMYVGTNDKDTYSQIIGTDEAKTIIDGICLKYLDGYTLQDAVGAWSDETETPTHEDTIVCYFDNTNKETVYKIADEVIDALNQSTVLIEEDYIHTEFYSAK